MNHEHVARRGFWTCLSRALFRNHCGLVGRIHGPEVAGVRFRLPAAVRGTALSFGLRVADRAVPEKGVDNLWVGAG